MGDTASVSDKYSASEQMALRTLPIFGAIMLGLGLPFLSFLTVEFFKLAIRLPERPQMPWLADYYFHIALFCYAYIAIRIMKLRRPGAYGFRWPVGHSYVLTALLWGVVIGALSMPLDHWLEVFGARRVYQFFSPTPLNIAGWIAFDGVAIGVCQETMFRGFLMSFLAQTMPGRVRLGSFSMNVGGIVAAAVYALFVVLYSATFLSLPLIVVLGQFFCAFVLGVLFAYWFEQSKSLLAPIIGHNAAALTEQVLVFLMLSHVR